MGDDGGMEPAREIPLSQGMVAIVDAADYDAVMAFNWREFKQRNGTSYADRHVRKPDGRQAHQFLHTFLTGWPYVDHRNGNGLDNRRANLRAATHAENMRNRGLFSNSTSGFKGVSWSKHVGKWQAAIRADGKRHYLGCYSTAEAAALAYDVAAVELHGAFAWLNFPDIDHRNREATNAKNQQNRARRPNMSGFRGVCWSKSREKWVATIGVDGKGRYLGRFPTAEEAARAYDAAARELRGTHAWLNFPEAVAHHPIG